jgi:hypothetical protein
MRKKFSQRKELTPFFLKVQIDGILVLGPGQGSLYGYLLYSAKAVD